MDINVICIGKLKERYWTDAIAEYSKRLKPYCALKLAEKMADLALEGHSTIDFIIGGSLGLSAEVSGRADYKLSFSDMTFPHQMMRVILLEQIYRSYKIQRGEPYHK